MNINPPLVELAEMIQGPIENCIMHLMTKVDCINYVTYQFDIDPLFCETVWNRMEELYPNFFMLYYTRMAIKGEVEQLNWLFEIHDSLLREMQPNANVQHAEMDAADANVVGAQGGHAAPPPDAAAHNDWSNHLSNGYASDQH